MFAKVDVNGADAHPLFNWLKDEKGGLLGDRSSGTSPSSSSAGTAGHRALRPDHRARRTSPTTSAPPSRPTRSAWLILIPIGVLVGFLYFVGITRRRARVASALGQVCPGAGAARAHRLRAGRVRRLGRVAHTGPGASSGVGRPGVPGHLPLPLPRSGAGVARLRRHLLVGAGPTAARTPTPGQPESRPRAAVAVGVTAYARSRRPRRRSPGSRCPRRSCRRSSTASRSLSSPTCTPAPCAVRRSPARSST